MTPEPTVEQKTFITTLITNSQNISIQASSNAWVAIISLSGILTSGFSMVYTTMNEKHPIPICLVILFFLLTLGICWLLIRNYTSLRDMYKDEVSILMRMFSPLTVPTQEEQTAHDDKQKQAQKCIFCKEKLVYGGLVIQISILFFVLVKYR